MFTGLIERTAEVCSLASIGSDQLELRIDPGKDFKVQIGDSVSVNGCCLTVTELISPQFIGFQLSRETLDKTTFKALVPTKDTVKRFVNIERALRLEDRLGGHLVSGHVDGKGRLLSKIKEGEFAKLTIEVPLQFRHNVIFKGSIALDGISLTVNTVRDSETQCQIELMIIPKTLELTNLKYLQAHDEVHLEFDMIGKYIERLFLSNSAKFRDR